MNIILLADIDGLGSRKVGGQLLCAYRDTDDADSALTKKKQKRHGENPLAAQSGIFRTHPYWNKICIQSSLHGNI